MQVDGHTMDIVLEEVKLVPGLDMPLFGILKALHQGWKIRNKGVNLTIYKGDMALTFDRELPTRNGTLVAVSLLPRSGRSRGQEMCMPVEAKSIWNINRMHQVFNHAGEEALRTSLQLEACGQA